MTKDNQKAFRSMSKSAHKEFICGLHKQDTGMEYTGMKASEHWPTSQPVQEAAPPVDNKQAQKEGAEEPLTKQLATTS
ncbi:hypothetical protein DSO57_1004720 [Entomophthora muscae]|uniref:Uncharacterized protein n=1 Tax=Entomophthora muscae TaxID=34485 RepID=A0ACC2SXH0_9FUNG|nr:hypothetical protein DSO57_1004720 [Entomophthora muscae]